MKLVATRPVTIEKCRYGERWFPFMFRHTDGSLLLYVEYGHDAHWAPFMRLRSTDGGRTWGTPVDNVPRATWCHSFADGELFELDTYGVQDPKAPEHSAFFGCWSNPAKCDGPVRKGLARFHGPSLKPVPLAAYAGRGSYPTFHWWPLWNGLHGNDHLKGDEIFLLGPYVTSGIELTDGRLLTTAYWEHRDPAIKKSCVFCFESKDRGHNWAERSLVSHDASTPEGPDEASMTHLKDGRLYVVMRTGGIYVHSWSKDEGRTWSPHQPMRLIDSSFEIKMAWPSLAKLADGTLVLGFGRPGKHLIFDPSGTGTQWQGHLDLHGWELETQALMGVPEDQRLRGRAYLGERYWDSGDYLSVVPVGPREMLVVYDVQSYVENWNADPFSGVRMVRVRLEE